MTKGVARTERSRNNRAEQRSDVMKKVQRSTRSSSTLSGASTLGNAQLGNVRGGATMVEYALVASSPAVLTNPPTLVSNPPTLATSPRH
jgi:hypothetical protein